MFLDEGIAVVGSWYSQCYAFEGLHRHNPIESMAAAYTSVYTNRSREWKVKHLARQFERYDDEAAIFHDARTAPEHSAVRAGIHIRLRRETGVTPIVVEADTHDLRLVSVDHIRGQIREFVEQRRAAGDPWLEFFRVPDLSLGLYVLAAGSEDLQSPHGQDEIYFVVSGTATFRVEGVDTPATPGAILYVAAEADHKFHTVEEELTLLVFFAPAYEQRADER